jgi:aminoglycoside phosphotransferase (APT) family kinase protein
VAERRTADLRALGAVVRSRLASVCEVWLQPIGTGKHNASYWVHADGCRYVLRVAPPDDAGLLFYERRMMRQEPALHALIRARTRVPVAEVVAHDFTRTQLDRDYVLLEALPGTALSEVTSFGPPQLDRVLFQVGEHLRQLHALTADDCLGLHAYGYLGAHRPMPPQPTWEAAFGMMWNLLLDDVVASGCYAPAEADRLQELYRQHHQHFQHPVEPRLLHMDVWAQNILVDELGNVTGLVDLDRALWGDPEIEFAVLDYCGISEPAFWRGYGQGRDRSPSAEIRRLFYLLYEVQKYMPIHVWRRGDPAGARRYRAHKPGPGEAAWAGSVSTDAL